MSAPDNLCMDLIAEALSVDEWSPDTLDQIADIVRLSGRTIADCNDSDDDE